MSAKVYFDEIKRLLPQDYPFIFVDRVEHYEEFKSITCVKNITGNEWAVTGHFPKQAIFPGVLINEGFGQATILLIKLSQKNEEQRVMEINSDSTFLMTSAKIRYLKTIVPGDQLYYHCNIVKLTSNSGVIEGIAKIDNEEIAAKAELVFCVK
ncbi:3-hydroxyacyl-ACP dehydratase FabZ [Paenibacillus sp. 481]|uniref:3-hydroxyacyl-ACP dehydratase FabZ n=1 Tax=Paenibacillus sp. 481 TaxID=2835869 RepID=UPI001E3ECB56|nr:3-hydroxyacyl-ACP dehydratase FabZ [Paenibacillus sp. 481]UHA72037.1 3-hydroxyacyl-ACP dehydratase FabZ [Paenibacillus sp. 481]